MPSYFDILKNVCTLAHEEEPLGFSSADNPYAEIKLCIKNTVEEICSRYKWSFRERINSLNTQAGVKEYSFPTGAETQNILENGVRIEGVSTPLMFVFHEDMDKFYSASGKPCRYSVYAGKIIFYPVPDRVYSIQVKYLTSNFAYNSSKTVEKSNLDLETDVCIIPDRFIKTVEWGALALYRQNYKPDNKYSLAREKFLEYFIDMQKQDGHGGDSGGAIVMDKSTDFRNRILRDFF